MKKIITLSLLLLTFGAMAQEDAWVYFNAKPDAASYLANPLTMLTQRALDRRTAQNIPLDNLDVPVYQPYIDQVENATGITVMAKSKWHNAVHVRGTQSQVNALTSLAFVDHIRFANPALNPSGRPHPAVNSVTHRTQKVNETAVVFNYGNSANQIQMLNGHLLHQQDFTGQGKVVAVMDGGFPSVDTNPVFARLRDNGHILGGYDYVNRNADFYTGISHGTMVLSTMGGYKDGQLVGTAPDADYYLFITEDGNNESPLEESLWVEAAEEADRLGADVLSTSLGYSEFDNIDYNHTYDDMDGQTAFISQGANYAFSRGMVCVVAAGNEGNNDWFYITAPADAPGALTVGAVTASGNYASFSSHGPSSDDRIKPDVAAKGQSATVANTNGSITTANGTSFACPILAGMVASFWQAVPTLTNAEVVQYIRQSASIYDNPNDEIGYGIPDFSAALGAALGTTNFAADGFALYPNPTANEVKLTLPIESGTFDLYNALGVRVLEQYVSKTSVIDLEQLAPGVYFYRVAQGNFARSGQIIKQ